VTEGFKLKDVRDIAMHNYSIELKVWGEIPSERDISGRLGVQATTFFKKGEAKSPTREWQQSVWSLSVEPSETQREWPSLEEGLGALLELLAPLKPQLEELKHIYQVAISCGDFVSGFGGGPTLSASILQRLADLGLDLNLSIYSHDEPVSQKISEK